MNPTILTASTSKHEEKYGIEEAECHSDDVLVKDS